MSRLLVPANASSHSPSTKAVATTQQQHQPGNSHTFECPEPTRVRVAMRRHTIETPQTLRGRLNNDVACICVWNVHPDKYTTQRQIHRAINSSILTPAILKMQLIFQPNNITRMDVYVRKEVHKAILRKLKNSSKYHDWYGREHRPFIERTANKPIQRHQRVTGPTTKATKGKTNSRDNAKAKICSLNVNSIWHKKADLRHMAYNYGLDIILLQETCVYHESWRFRIPGYVCFAKDAIAGKTGARGLAIAIATRHNAHIVGKSSPFYMACT